MIVFKSNWSQLSHLQVGSFGSRAANEAFFDGRKHFRRDLKGGGRHRSCGGAAGGFRGWMLDELKTGS